MVHDVATSAAELCNEGLDPGVRVLVDDLIDEKATICFAERDVAFWWVRLDRDSRRIRVASWRLARVG